MQGQRGSGLLSATKIHRPSPIEKQLLLRVVWATGCSNGSIFSNSWLVLMRGDLYFWLESHRCSGCRTSLSSLYSPIAKMHQPHQFWVGYGVVCPPEQIWLGYVSFCKKSVFFLTLVCCCCVTSGMFSAQYSQNALHWILGLARRHCSHSSKRK